MIEIREVNERDNRKNSVVIRGVTCRAEHELNDNFNDACSYLYVGNVYITGLAELSPTVSTGDSHGDSFKNEVSL